MTRKLELDLYPHEVIARKRASGKAFLLIQPCKRHTGVRIVDIVVCDI